MQYARIVFLLYLSVQLASLSLVKNDIVYVPIKEQGDILMLANRKKELQTAKMYKIFINATVKVIEQEGIDRVTVRKVADVAGYTASTVYNYFDELSHLVFFASMRHLEDYNIHLESKLKEAKNPVEKYISTWEFFFEHSFKMPQTFNAVFMSNLGIDPKELIDRYYTIYSSNLEKFSEELKFIVLEHDMFERNRPMLEEAANEGYIKHEDVEFILGSSIFIWQGILNTVLNNRTTYTPEYASTMAASYIKEIMKKCVIR